MKNTEIEKFLQNMKYLGKDYKPDAYPPVQTKDILAMVKLIKNMVPSIDLLQTRLENGCYLSKQDGEWWLFEEDGEGICGGKNLRDILVNLILLDC